MGTYALGIVSLISDRLAWLRWISPFRYIEGADIATAGQVDFALVTALVAASLAAVALTFSLYRRRDITV
jgi:ABC-2 type transport system permease protein